MASDDSKLIIKFEDGGDPNRQSRPAGQETSSSSSPTPPPDTQSWLDRWRQAHEEPVAEPVAPTPEPVDPADKLLRAGEPEPELYAPPAPEPEPVAGETAFYQRTEFDEEGFEIDDEGNVVDLDPVLPEDESFEIDEEGNVVDLFEQPSILAENAEVLAPVEAELVPAAGAGGAGAGSAGAAGAGGAAEAGAAGAAGTALAAFSALAIPVAAATVVLEALVLTVQAVDDEMNQLAQDLKKFSPEITQADSIGKIERTFAELERARELGGDLGQFTQGRNDIANALYRMETSLLKIITPLAGQITTDLAALVEAGEDIFNYLEGSNLKEFGTWLAESNMNLTLLGQFAKWYRARKGKEARRPADKLGKVVNDFMHRFDAAAAGIRFGDGGFIPDPRRRSPRPLPEPPDPFGAA